MVSLKKVFLKIAIVLSLLALPLAAHVFGQAAQPTKGCSRNTADKIPKLCTDDGAEWTDKCTITPYNRSPNWECALFINHSGAPLPFYRKVMADKCKAAGGDHRGWTINSVNGGYTRSIDICRFPKNLP